MKNKPTGQYIYSARLKKNYDGDTVTVYLNVGFGIRITRKLRLAQIDTPELRGSLAEKKAGKAAKLIVKEWLKDTDFIVETIRDRTGKFGRYLAIIHVLNQGEWINLNDWLVTNDYAVAY